jgi:hypothetical protein
MFGAVFTLALLAHTGVSFWSLVGTAATCTVTATTLLLFRITPRGVHGGSASTAPPHARQRRSLPRQSGFRCRRATSFAMCASNPIPATFTNSRPASSPTSMLRISPASAPARAAEGRRLIPSLNARPFPDPDGTIPSAVSLMKATAEATSFTGDGSRSRATEEDGLCRELLEPARPSSLQPTVYSHITKPSRACRTAVRRLDETNKEESI